MALATTIAKRAFSSTPLIHNAIKNVTVVGGGLMGSGIAQIAAQSGNHVSLVELNADVLKKSQASIEKNLTRVAKRAHPENASDAEKFVTETKNRIKGVTDAKEAVQDSDLVVEAIVENLETKHRLFAMLDEAAPAKTIFASNTSSLSIGEIADVTKRKDRFAGLHFFNPVPMMKLLEIVRTPKTSDATYAALMAWGRSIGKTCITCKDTPGFVVNRLLVPYLAEAVRMYERGDASKEDIDVAMKLGAGYPMGPFELLDYVGLDTTVFILQGWAKKYPNEPLFRNCESMSKLVGEGKMGRKSGEGFYNHKK